MKLAQKNIHFQNTPTIISNFQNHGIITEFHYMRLFHELTMTLIYRYVKNTYIEASVQYESMC